MVTNMMNKRFTEIFGINYPLIQAGMVWCSGYKLASAACNAGILGVLGAGSMNLDVLIYHIGKMKALGHKSFAVNLPLLYRHIDEQIELIIENEVPVVITSAGNPAKYTQRFKSAGIKVMHVVSSEKFALKAQQAGVDAVIAEGFEAGGHNGREETTSMVLLQQLMHKLDIPLVAAGGFSTGASVAAAFIMGAEAVQIGSRFAASVESSAHVNFKQAVAQAKEGDTILTLKELAPVRLLKNHFFDQLQQLYAECPEKEALQDLLGKGRARQGIFEGNLTEGELEIGQISSVINQSETVQQIVDDVVNTCNQLLMNAPNYQI